MRSVELNAVITLHGGEGYSQFSIGRICFAKILSNFWQIRIVVARRIFYYVKEL
jgi:hypothetical protein